MPLMGPPPLLHRFSRRCPTEWSWSLALGCPAVAPGVPKWWHRGWLVAAYLWQNWGVVSWMCWSIGFTTLNMLKQTLKLWWRWLGWTWIMKMLHVPQHAKKKQFELIWIHAERQKRAWQPWHQWELWQAGEAWSPKSVRISPIVRAIHPLKWMYDHLRMYLVLEYVGYVHKFLSWLMKNHQVQKLPQHPQPP